MNNLSRAFVYSKQLEELALLDRSVYRGIPVEVGKAGRSLQTQVAPVLPEIGLHAVDFFCDIPLEALAAAVKIDKVHSCRIPEPVPEAGAAFSRSGGVVCVRWLLRMPKESRLNPGLVAGLMTLAQVLDSEAVWDLDAHIASLDAQNGN